MHILMLGAGAMGCLLGARLSRCADARISLLSTNWEHIQSIRRHGLVIEELDGKTGLFELPAYYDPHSIKDKVDFVIVMVKAYAVKSAVAGIRSCCDHSTIFLTLQNGVGNWENIAEIVGPEPVLVGSTAQGATLVSHGRVRHGGNGPTYIGEIEGPVSDRVRKTVELFREAGLVAEPSDRMQQLIWEKLIVNVGINAITALTGIRNGFIGENPVAGALCRAAVEEAAAVAKAKGFPLREDMPDRVLAVARSTAINRSSMGQDVDRRKRTEIDAINGAIVGFGAELGIPTPINRTLTQLVKILEAAYQDELGSQ